jgi:hypothetical protein
MTRQELLSHANWLCANSSTISFDVLDGDKATELFTVGASVGALSVVGLVLKHVAECEAERTRPVNWKQFAGKPWAYRLSSGGAMPIALSREDVRQVGL